MSDQVSEVWGVMLNASLAENDLVTGFQIVGSYLCLTCQAFESRGCLASVVLGDEDSSGWLRVALCTDYWSWQK